MKQVKVGSDIQKPRQVKTYRNDAEGGKVGEPV
jgi:hypothetical protein